MKKAIIKPDFCKNCSPCLVKEKCDGDAIIRESVEEKPWVDFYKCRGCMKCIDYCRNNAVGEITHPLPLKNFTAPHSKELLLIGKSAWHQTDDHSIFYIKFLVMLHFEFYPKAGIP